MKLLDDDKSCVAVHRAWQLTVVSRVAPNLVGIPCAPPRAAEKVNVSTQHSDHDHDAIKEEEDERQGKGGG